MENEYAILVSNRGGDYSVTIYIALLRGINVGGHKVIKMDQLKRMFEALGLAKVQTYIQSGNVLFESAETAASLRTRIEQEIQTVFSFEVTVVLRTLDELKRVIDASIFQGDQLQEGETLYVALLADKPTSEGRERLLTFKSEVDDYHMTEDEVYIFCRQSIRKSLFSNNFLEKQLKVSATTRNWNTMNKLIAMGEKLQG